MYALVGPAGATRPNCTMKHHARCENVNGEGPGDTQQKGLIARATMNSVSLRRGVGAALGVEILLTIICSYDHDHEPTTSILRNVQMQHVRVHPCRKRSREQNRAKPQQCMCMCTRAPQGTAADPAHKTIISACRRCDPLTKLACVVGPQCIRNLYMNPYGP
jgi:hypothetical protein